MILKGSQRGGAKQLGLHLVKAEENEHVELHDIRGFLAEDVVGALREAEAVSIGTKCRQFLFSVSLNPPERENVHIETFKKAIEAIEEQNGLTDQPRIVIFHEKEGRRHCHAVWSRIDADTMTARPLPFFKTKLRDVSRQLYLENGWQMPRGLIDPKDRDPRNFTLDEWQQAKRIGRHAGELKVMIQEAWSISDSAETFSHALEERGLYLARGDRRGHVAVTYEGEVISIPRATGRKSKDVQARLGKPESLRSIEETRKHVARQITPRIHAHLKDARAKATAELSRLEHRRMLMADAHSTERAKLDTGQKERFEKEARERADRFRKGMAGLWDRLIGKRARLEMQNQVEAIWALRRDQDQRQMLVSAQLSERRALQVEIKTARSRHAEVIRSLHFDLTNSRLMKWGQEPKARRAFEQTKTPLKQPSRTRLDRLKEAQTKPPCRTRSPQDRLNDLREEKKGPSRDGPEFER